MTTSPIRFKLESGAYLTMFTTNFCILECKDGTLRIEDGIHNNGGWRLDTDYTYEQVLSMIMKAK